MANAPTDRGELLREQIATLHRKYLSSRAIALELNLDHADVLYHLRILKERIVKEAHNHTLYRFSRDLVDLDEEEQTVLETRERFKQDGWLQLKSVEARLKIKERRARQLGYDGASVNETGESEEKSDAGPPLTKDSESEGDAGLPGV